jgi:glycosyltransferase involved in cell wall biosynthesis
MVTVCIISTVHNALDNRIFYREACSLQNSGYSVYILAIHDREETKAGIRILPIKRVARLKRPLVWLKVLKKGLSIKADIYHIHDPELLFISPLLRLFGGHPVVYDIHESVADFFEIKDDLPRITRSFFAWLFRWLEPALASIQNGLIFADEQIASSFNWIKRPKVTLHNFPSQSFLLAASQVKNNSRDEHPSILYLGGIKRNRGTPLMIEAFARVFKVNPHAHLYLVGPFVPPPLETEMRTEFDRRGMIHAVTITGAVPFEQVGDYLAQATVGWIPFPPVPKYQKNIPTKLFEYMAYAVPVVSSDLKSTRQFIENGKNGILVMADNPEAHAKAIIEMISNREKAAELGRNGQASVFEHYRWSEEEKKLLWLYEKVLSSS